MARTATNAQLGGFASDAVVGSIGLIVVAGGVALGLVRYLNADSAQRAMEGPWGALALGAVVAAPGVLVLLALRDRPVLLLPTAIILLPLSVLSFAGVLLPLLIPAGILFGAYRRRSVGDSLGPSRTAVVALWVVALLMAAVMSLFAHQDPRSYATPTGSGETSDVITPLETLVCLTLVSAAIATGWMATAPWRRPIPGAPGRSDVST